MLNGFSSTTNIIRHAFFRQSKHDAIEICSYATRCTSGTTKMLFRAVDVAGYMTRKHPAREGVGPLVSLMLVKILCESDGSLRMPCETFLQVFDACELQPYLLYFVKHSSYIFYCFEPQIPSTPSDPKYAMSFYMNTAFFVLLWSFDAETSSIRAQLLQRRRELETFEDLEILINIHKSMFADPLMLALVSANSISEWVESNTLPYRVSYKASRPQGISGVVRFVIGSALAETRLWMARRSMLTKQKKGSSATSVPLPPARLYFLHLAR
jgi:hypothetical protein